VLNAHPKHRLPNTLTVSFAGKPGTDVLAKLDRMAASTGSACHAGRIELSPVLETMGISPAIGMAAVRFIPGRGATRAAVDTVADSRSNGPAPNA